MIFFQMRRLLLTVISVLVGFLLTACASWGRQLTSQQYFQGLTGLSPAQTSVANACPEIPGLATCMAQELVDSTSHRPITTSNLHSFAQVNTAVSGSVDPLTPQQLQQAYGTTSLSSSTGGAVAVLASGDDPYLISDLNTFRQNNNLGALSACSTGSTPCINVVNQAGQASPLPTSNYGYGPQDEETLDVDAVSTLCPHCSIDVVEANASTGQSGGQTYVTSNASDLASAYTTAVAMNPSAVSISYGFYSAPSTSFNQEFFSSDIPTFVASGDSAYDNDYSSDPDTISYPAANVDDVAVGGTSIYPNSSARGWGETVWSNPNPGSGQTPSGSGSGCNSLVAVPSYQLGLSTGCVGRAYTDISADADPYSGLVISITQPYCNTSSNPNCTPAPTTSSYAYGGTSLAAPLTASYAVLTGVANTYDSNGDADPAWVYSNPNLLNPIGSGTNGTNTDCGNVSLCVAGLGAWNGPSGMGSINASPRTPELPNNWAAAVGSTSATFSGQIYPNGGATLTLSVAGLTGTSVVSGYTLSQGSVTVGGLAPGTSYSYSLVTSNSGGSTSPQTGTFTTSGTPQTGVSLSSSPVVISSTPSTTSSSLSSPPNTSSTSKAGASPKTSYSSTIKFLKRNTLLVTPRVTNPQGRYSLKIIWGDGHSQIVKSGRKYSHLYRKHRHYLLKLEFIYRGHTYVASKRVNF